MSARLKQNGKVARVIYMHVCVYGTYVRDVYER